jgi:lipoprotein-anchoring transpeptidase ErfK/SrfK
MWVAVSIKAQMMAIYNGPTRIFTTMVATGRPGYETVKGDFSALGYYRPLSQTMAGGNRAAGDGYELENIRNVTYFYQDFAIHGSYWHAKYGLVPQSHGCVNATVYDAGLVYQLPAGTPVEVF